MRSLRVLAGVAILALAAPLVCRASTSNAASLAFRIIAYQSVTSTTPTHTGYMTLAGWTGGAINSASVRITHEFTVGGVLYQDQINSEYYSTSTISGTVQIGPTLPTSPQYVVALNVTLTPYPGATTRIVGSGVIDRLHSKLLGGTFTVTMSGLIDRSSKAAPDASWQFVSRSIGTFTETIRVPAFAIVILD